MGIGPAFVSERRFSWRPDTDSVVAGFLAEPFFGELPDCALNTTPIESATEAVRRALLEDEVAV